MKAMAEFVRKMYKVKMDKGDIIPKIEGKKSDEWMAMDLGNIALHIFSANVRRQYDLEMLWSVGADYDTETNKPSDPIYELFDQHSKSLSGYLTNRNQRVIGTDQTNTNTVQLDENTDKNQSKNANANDWEFVCILDVQIILLINLLSFSEICFWMFHFVIESHGMDGVKVVFFGLVDIHFERFLKSILADK